MQIQSTNLQVTDDNTESIKLALIKNRFDEQVALEKLAIQTMFECESTLSNNQKAVVASTVSSIAMKVFPAKDRRESWLAVLAIESCFNSDAESPKGAAGIGQLTLDTAKGYAEQCGLSSDIQWNDLFDININGIISACVFNKYIDKKDGIITLALVGYNHGIHSDMIKKLNNLKSINMESANYIAKYSIIMEKIRR